MRGAAGGAMTATVYGRDALRRLREQQKQAAEDPPRQRSLLQQVPADAPMDDATIGVWDGERFISYQKWLARAPFSTETCPEDCASPVLAGADCVVASYGATRVWLVREGDRWTMFAGSRNSSGRRRDFASPFLAHAMRTAELWYGAPSGGWQLEKGRDARTSETANLSLQDSTDQERSGEGVIDVDLDGR